MIDATWVRGDDTVTLAVYATGPETMGGIAMIGTDCEGRVTGSWTEWTE